MAGIGTTGPSDQAAGRSSRQAAMRNQKYAEVNERMIHCDCFL
jgi:hypothetical protein